MPLSNRKVALPPVAVSSHGKVSQMLEKVEVASFLHQANSKKNADNMWLSTLSVNQICVSCTCIWCSQRERERERERESIKYIRCIIFINIHI